MEKVKLGDCTNIISGFAFDSKLFNDKDGMPLIRIRDVKRGFTETYTTEKCDEKYLVENNDILIGMDGEFNIEKWRSGQALLNQRVCKVIPKKDIDKDYIYFLLPKKLKDIENKTSYATVKHISIKQIENIEFNYVILEEQKKIASKLRNIKQIIDIRKKQIEDLEQLIKSQFVELFEKRIDSSFEKCTIGDIYRFQYGKGNKIPESQGQYPCYGSNGQVGYHTEYNNEDAPIIGHIGAYAGVVVWATGKHFVTYNGVMCFVKKKSKVNPIYGYYLLKMQDFANTIRRGIAQPFVSYDILEAPEIDLPPIELQNQFAEFVKLIDRQKFELQKSLEELQKLQESLMSKYFGE